MGFIDPGDTHLSRAQFGELPGDLKTSLAFENEEDLMSQVVAVPVGDRPWFHAQKARTDLW